MAKTTAREARMAVRATAEQLVFRHGGWLQVGARMGMTGEALRRKVFFNPSIVDARQWLGNIERELNKETRDGILQESLEGQSTGSATGGDG